MVVMTKKKSKQDEDGWKTRSIRLPPDLDEWLVAVAANQRRSINQEIVWLLEQAKKKCDHDVHP